MPTDHTEDAKQGATTLAEFFAEFNLEMADEDICLACFWRGGIMGLIQLYLYQCFAESDPVEEKERIINSFFSRLVQDGKRDSAINFLTPDKKH